MYATVLLVSLSLTLPSPQTDWREKSAQRIEQGAADEAITIIEEHLTGAPESAAGYRALGNALEQMWRQGKANFLIVDDARVAWNRAVELEPFDIASLEGAASIHMLLGEYENAAKLGMRTLGACRIGAATIPDGLLEMISRARIGAFQAKEHATDDSWSKGMEDVWRAIKGAREIEPDSSSLAAVEAEFLTLIGLPDLAISSLTTALETMRTDPNLYGLLIDLHTRSGIENRLPPLFSSLGVFGMNGTLAWYTGYVQRLVGDSAQRERRFDEARDAYEQAIEWMQATTVLEPGFRVNADAIRHQSEVSIAWCLLGSGDLDAAEPRLLVLLEQLEPTLDAVDGLGRTAMNGLSKLGEKISALNQFGRAADVARAVVAVTPEDGLWWNNLGFLLREYGTQIENGVYPKLGDKDEAARRVYEESWQAYQRAVEAVPDDARIVNDAALMQVYHVRDSLDEAEELLHRSIRLGESQLAEMEDNPPESKRFPIAQAVGDAYQNLGYLYYHLLDKPLESREFWVASMATDSGDRSGFQRYLDAIDGAGDPVALRDGSFVVAPLDEPRPTAVIEWQSSVAEAREIAAAESRPLLIYNRGQGLGLLVPYLDTLARSDRFKEQTDGAVVLVADGVNHNFVERTRSGRRLPCPKWGPMTCLEHLTAATEFASWYFQNHGSASGESEEALWIQPVGGEMTAMEMGFELFVGDMPIVVDASATTTVDLPELVRRAAYDTAAPLVAVRRRAARDRVERLLFEGPENVQGNVIGALRADEHRLSRELIDSAIRQLRDPGLARLALNGWRDGGDVTALEQAARWSSDTDLRQAAAKVLETAKEGYGRVAIARAIVARDF